MKNTYWNSNGTYQAFAEFLGKLIPVEGSVANPRKNPKLEKFRKAQNAYYDLFNNGLYNRAAEFRAVFGIPSGRYRINGQYGRSHSELMYELVEAEMDKIILAAMDEQVAIANKKVAA